MIERTNKDITGLLAERVIEVEHEGRIDAKTFNGAQFLRQGVNQWRNFFRRDDGIRVSIECDEQSDGFVLSGVRQGLADALLVAKLDAMRRAEGDGNLARA